MSEQETSAQRHARERRTSGTGDMVRSMLVLLLPILVLGWLLTNRVSEPPLPTVDWRAQVAAARAEAPYPVLAPSELPGGGQDWRCTKASWIPVGRPGLNQEPSPRNQWELGFIAPSGVHIGLTQGDLAPVPLIASATRDGLADGETRIGQGSWERYISKDGRTRSLVQRTDRGVAIVSGDTDYPALEEFAGTLTDH